MVSDPRPHPDDYLRYANQFHRAGAVLLQELDWEHGEPAQLAVTIGLFLQAIELAGKSILRATGLTAKEIRDRHRWHGIFNLIRDVQRQIIGTNNPELERFHDIKDHKIQIFAYGFSGSVGELTEKLAESKEAGKPRNYFYPDHHEFSAFDPPWLNRAVERMVDKLIRDASEIARILGWEGSFE